MLIFVALRMSVRGMIKDFPVFFAYTIFHIVAIVATLAASQASPWTYFYAYWGFEVADVFLTLAVVQEIFRHTFEPFPSVQGLGTSIFRWATLALCGVSILAATRSTGADSIWMMSAILNASKFADFLVVALLCILFGLAAVLGIKWQKRTLQFALGLAVVTGVGVATTTIRTQFGEIAHPMYALIKPLSYNLGCVLWVSAMYAEYASRNIDISRFRHLSEWSATVEGIGNK